MKMKTKININNKKPFSWQHYCDNENYQIAIKPETIEEVEQLFELFKKYNRHWSDGEEYDFDEFDGFNSDDNICYGNDGTVASIFEYSGYDIYSFSDVVELSGAPEMKTGVKAKQIHIMADIETLGKDLDPVVTQISAIAFDIKTGEEYGKFNEFINLPENIHVNNSSLKWWLTTDPKLLRCLLESCEKSIKEEKEVIADFSSWINSFSRCESNSNVFLWGNGILFDNRIISQKCQKHFIEYPIFYRNDRDMRTIVDLAATKIGMDSDTYRAQFEFTGTQHNALDDVRHQIKVVCAAYKTLGLLED